MLILLYQGFRTLVTALAGRAIQVMLIGWVLFLIPNASLLGALFSARGVSENGATGITVSDGSL